MTVDAPFMSSAQRSVFKTSVSVIHSLDLRLLFLFCTNDDETAQNSMYVNTEKLWRSAISKCRYVKDSLKMKITNELRAF